MPYVQDALVAEAPNNTNVAQARAELSCCCTQAQSTDDDADGEEEEDDDGGDDEEDGHYLTLPNIIVKDNMRLAKGVEHMQQDISIHVFLLIAYLFI